MRTLKLLGFLFGSAVLSISCEEIKTNGEGEPPVVVPIEITAPNTIIPLQEAEDMYHLFGAERVPLIEETVNIDEDGNAIKPNDDRYVQATRSLSMDYKTLKQYLAFIEQEAGDANTDISGLRIYFSKYRKGKNDSRATVFLNPIMEAGKKGDLRDDVSFAIKKEGKKSIAVPVGKLIKVPEAGSNRADLKMPVQDGVQSLASNKSPWTPPPPYNEDDFQ